MPNTESAPGSPHILDFDRDDDLIDIFFDKPTNRHGHGGGKGPTKGFYDQVIDKSSNAFSYIPVSGAEILRRLYPKHSLLMTRQQGLLSLPGVSVEPLEEDQLITNVFFIPISRSLGSVPGVLVENVEYGGFKLNWNGHDFILFVVTYPIGFGTSQQQYILHEGPDDPTRLLLLSLGAWANSLHDEIWVYNQGWWQKSHALWKEVQTASWDDVILKDDFKKALQKDVYGFFASESVYKDLGIAWKRGLILYGPPGNGKTISLKTIMKTCGEQGFHPLYVKSFQNWAGEEAAMADVFDKARQLSPCVIILEDLDSLINDQNRSFFLNQVDGIEGNDGLLLIGTTNHFERLDPGLSTRPSRFDRKFKFDDPDLYERSLYAKYWQKKLKSNSAIDFPDSLVQEIADITDRFSFAYLKEAFVSTLVTLAGIEGDKPAFETLLKAEIKTLRKQLDKSAGYTYIQEKMKASPSQPPAVPIRPPRPHSSNESDIRSLLDALSESSPMADSPGRRFFTDMDRDINPRPSDEDIRKGRDIRALLDALADHLDTSDVASFRRYEAPLTRRYGQHDEREVDQGDGSYRALLDRLTERERDMRLFDLQQNSRHRPSRRSAPVYDENQEWNGYHTLHQSGRLGAGLPKVPNPTSSDLA